MAKDRPIVWVLKEQMRTTPNGSSPMDYSAAYVYGDLEFITDFDPPLHPSSTVMPEWRRQIRKFLDAYKEDYDYIIPTGSPFAIFLFGRMLGEEMTMKGIKQARILVWRREQSRYIVSNI